MIDTPKLALESGASLEKMHNGLYGIEWWRFSPDELQIYTEKVMQAAQAAERERAKELVEALNHAAAVLDMYVQQRVQAEYIRNVIAKYEAGHEP